MYNRFDSWRPSQKDMANDIYGALQSKLSIMCHAPTGIGKTDASLGPALTFAIENKLSVLFLTPKISQHRIAVDVVRGIAAKYHLDITGSDIVGKPHMCCHKAIAMNSGELFYRSCEKARKYGQCKFYNNIAGHKPEEQARAAISIRNYMIEHRVIEEFHETKARSESQELCPYEMAFKVGEQSEIIISDYLYFFLPATRDMFLSKLSKRLSDMIVIVDEAHNVPARLREHLSARITLRTVEKAMDEAKAIGKDGSLAELEKLYLRYRLFAGENTQNVGEKLVAKDEFLSLFDDYDGVVKLCAGIADEFMEKTNKRSACLKLAGFLEQWKGSDEGYVRILRRDNFALAKKSLDASPASKIINHAYAGILMSGTLKPLDVYANLIGVEHAMLREYSCPFPRENALYAVVPDITTRYAMRNEKEYGRIAATIRQLAAIASPAGFSPTGENLDGCCHRSPKMAVFFPSYVVLKEVCKQLDFGPNLKCYFQGEYMRPREIRALLNGFRKNGDVLLGVQGGSLSEGIDYTNNELKFIMVVGMPFDDMNLETKSQIEYFDRKFGNGWEYAYVVPAMTKCLQAAGRGIRSETDKCAIAFVDERFGWPRYRKYLPLERKIVFANWKANLKAFCQENFAVAERLY
ncbi:hypothetical protein COX84_02255 [Candidatus Micrarchaeota archaeon CG_4_10_14_0_2_um_filter_49_7]|nr:MAG: hypothetical protein COX84_02255 [Candidatus Micrarchaeota archaeon CG_4_10_14_0_2_um_filter_49_7]HII54273.1 ATP-dependent DNA helicase [Candidatus Micrarchaeota archaeon]